MSVKFQTVPLIESGLGKVSFLTSICDQLNVKKPIIMSDEGVYNLGFVKKVEHKDSKMLSKIKDLLFHKQVEFLTNFIFKQGIIN